MKYTKHLLAIGARPRNLANMKQTFQITNGAGVQTYTIEETIRVSANLLPHLFADLAKRGLAHEIHMVRRGTQGKLRMAYRVNGTQEFLLV